MKSFRDFLGNEKVFDNIDKLDESKLDAYAYISQILKMFNNGYNSIDLGTYYVTIKRYPRGYLAYLEEDGINFGQELAFFGNTDNQAIYSGAIYKDEIQIKYENKNLKFKLPSQGFAKYFINVFYTLNPKGLLKLDIGCVENEDEFNNVINDIAFKFLDEAGKRFYNLLNNNDLNAIESAIDTLKKISKK